MRSASKDRSGDVSLKSLSGLHLKLFYVTFSFFKLLSYVPYAVIHVHSSLDQSDLESHRAEWMSQAQLQGDCCFSP